jgi:hypothetical protein
MSSVFDAQLTWPPRDRKPTTQHDRQSSSLVGAQLICPERDKQHASLPGPLRSLVPRDTMTRDAPIASAALVRPIRADPGLACSGHQTAVPGRADRGLNARLHVRSDRTSAQVVRSREQHTNQVCAHG